jgi:hypothetical protein
VELLGIDLPDFCQTFQKYIDDGTLIPGWHWGQNFRLAGQACHTIWLESYKEEYEGLKSNDTFDIISEEDYLNLCKQHGIKAIPSMCTFMIK